jgi:hypothetical protein
VFDTNKNNYNFFLKNQTANKKRKKLHTKVKQEQRLSPLWLLEQNIIIWVTYKQQTFISQFSRLGNPRSRHWQIWCLVSIPFVIDGAFLLYPHMVGQASILRSQILIMT